jgi:ABC-type antimicrobial peptide transport system permease subunit
VAACAAQRDGPGAGDRHHHLALAIIAEATLSFLGVGVPPTTPSLGTLIRIGNDFLFSGEWWITIFPGIALCCWRCQSTCWATGCATRSTRS